MRLSNLHLEACPRDGHGSGCCMRSVILASHLSCERDDCNSTQMTHILVLNTIYKLQASLTRHNFSKPLEVSMPSVASLSLLGRTGTFQMLLFGTRSSSTLGSTPFICLAFAFSCGISHAENTSLLSSLVSWRQMLMSLPYKHYKSFRRCPN